MQPNIQGLNENLQKKIADFLKEAGDKVRVTQGFRTVQEQQALYAQGRTKPGKVVTDRDGLKAKSDHQLGNAFDIAFRGSAPYPAVEEFQKIADIAKKYGIIWPYRDKNWKWDAPHFEDDGKPYQPQQAQQTLTQESMLTDETIKLLGSLHPKLQAEDKLKIEALAKKLRALQAALGEPVTK